MSIRKGKVQKRKILTTVILVVVLLLSGLGLAREIRLNNAQRDFTALMEANAGRFNDGRLVLASTSSREAQRIADTLDGSLRTTANGRFALITLPDGVTLADVAENRELRQYMADFSLDYNDFSVGTEETDVAEDRDIRANFQTDEPMYPHQTYLDYINIGDCWNVSMGKKPNGEKVKVAVIDSGIDTDHPEFTDVDGNSIISTMSYDATDDIIVKNDSISVIEDEHGHGTAVAGIIASQINGKGVMGIAPDVEILVIKCDVDETGAFKSGADIVFGIYYAIEQNVDVINMSLGASKESQDLEKVLQLAVDGDIITVVAAGNDTTAIPHYPASLDTTIGVGAIARDSWELADYSNYGDNSDIMAPGTALTAAMGGGYITEDGTSMSAPIVSAAVAIYKSQHPYATFEEVKNDLLAAGKDLGEPGNDLYFGFGALDMNAFICEEKGTVTYDFCTEDLENATQVFVKQHTIQTVPEPERENIIFDDWYYDKGYTRVFDYDAWYTTEFVENVTLYAKWVNEDDEGASVYTYKTLNDGSIEIISYKGKHRYLTIPDEIDGKTVSSIGSDAFSGNTRLREIVLPKGLKKIRANAFGDASRLRAVIFTGTELEEIGESAFRKCIALRKLELPDSVVTIGHKAFENCSALSEVTITDTSALASIGENAFSKTNLSYLYLPKGVTNFDGSALLYCRNMRSVDVHLENSAFIVRNGMVLSADGTVLVYYPAVLAGTLNVPDGVVTIGDYACTASMISQVVFPESLEQIGELSYSEARITSLDIPAGVQNICPGAFKSCTKLKSVTFAENALLRVIDGQTGVGGAFEGCEQLVSLELPESLEVLGDRCFYACRSIPTLAIPANVYIMGDSSFEACTNLKTVVFDENCALTEISDYAFADCVKLMTIEFSDRIQTLGSDVFRCNYLLQTLTFGADSELSTVEDYCFYNCSALSQMQLPESVTVIGKYAYAFSGLSSVHVSKNLTSIGEGAFGACYDLNQITVDADNAVYTAVDNVLFDKNVTTVYCVPSSRIGSYTLPDTVQITAPCSFYFNMLLTEVILPEGLLDVQHDSFYSCSKLGSISIPDSVTNIGRMGFYNCRSIKKVTFGENSQLQRLGLYTFVSCGMPEISIPASVESMAQYVFSNCYNLKQITFKEGSRLSSVAAYLLRGTKVETVVFEEGSALTHIQAHAFDGAKELRSVDFGDAALKTIDNYAFYDCTKLEQVTIPATVTYLGRYAFYGCAGLSRFDIPASVDYVGISAFSGTGSKVFFEADTLPANAQDGWDEGIVGYFLAAKEYVVTEDWEYLITYQDTVALSRYYGSAKTLNIDSIDGLAVEKIGAGCFADNGTLTEVVLSANVREIDNYAFQNSRAVVMIPADSVLERIGNCAFSGNATTSLDLPDTVADIGTGAFESSCLKTLNISENSSLRTIGDRAFCGSGIEAIFLPASLETVGVEAFRNVLPLNHVVIADSNHALKISNSAFEGSGITEVTIPERVDYIGEYAFGSCPNLENIHVDSANTVYQDLDGVLLDSSGTTLIQYPCGRDGAYEIPSQITVLNYTSFKNAKGLNEVSFANGSTVRTIGWQTFSGCERLEKITVPDTVISFDFYAFENCTGLKTVVLGERNQLIGIYEGAFYGCSALEHLKLPDTVIDIGDYAFYGCTGLTEFPLTENAKTKGIGAHAFDGCSGITEIPELKALTDVGEYAFAHTSISEFRCAASIRAIGNSAFYGCESLANLYCDENNENYIGMDGAIYEKGASNASDYDALVAWPYGRIMVIGEGKTVISEEDTEFLKNGAAVRWAFADSVTEIGYQAFRNHRYMKHIPLTENITSIGDYAFYGCSSLESLTIHKNVVSLGRYLIYGCNNLKHIYYQATDMPDLIDANYAFASSPAMAFDITIGADVTRIPAHLFSSTKDYTLTGWRSASSCGVTELIFEENSRCTEIGEYAFAYCYGLKRITIPESVETVGNYAFAYTYQLEDMQFRAVSMNDLKNGNYVFVMTGVFGNGVHMRIGADVTRIPAYMFPISVTPEELNSNIRYVTFEEGSVCQSIGAGAFMSCPFLMHIMIPESVAVFGNAAFGSGDRALIMFEGDVPREYRSRFAHAYTDVVEYGITEDDYHYCVTADGRTVIGFYNGDETIVQVPAEVNGKQVTELSRTFYRTAVQEVYIPDTIKRIGECTFERCYDLTDVHLPEELSEIEEMAFYVCKGLEHITIPNSVTSIKTEAFIGCSELKWIRLESDYVAKSITQKTDYGNLLTYADTVVVPEYMGDPGSYILSNMPNKEQIILDGMVYTVYSGHEHIWSVEQSEEKIDCQRDGVVTYRCDICTLSKTEIDSAHVFTETIVGEKNCLEPTCIHQVCQLCGYERDYTIRAIGKHIMGDWQTVEEESYISAGKSIRTCNYCSYQETGEFEVTAFGSCGGGAEWFLTSVGELHIFGYGEMLDYNSGTAPWMPYKSSIRTVTIEGSLASIGNYAFENCTNLTSVTLADSIVEIGSFAFRGCSKLADVILPSNVTVIGHYAFADCRSLTSMVVPYGIICIDYYTFYGCRSLASVTIPDSVETISESAFAHCSSLTEVVIPEGASIGQSAFGYCSSLRSISLPKNLTGVGYGAFMGCTSLSSIDLPDGMKSIGSSMFSGCEKLTHVTIPNSVKTIGSSAFYGCHSLTDITLPNSITKIESSAFSGCSGLSDITIPDSVTTIGSHAFYGCSGLTAIQIPKSVTTIDDGAFSNCRGLKAITVEAQNSSYCSVDGVLMDYDRSRIISVPGGISGSYEIADGISALGESAFSGCENLTAVTIPDSVISIEESAFYRCTSLMVVRVPESVTSIGSSAFGYCSSLTEVELPDGISVIPSYLFQSCTSITTITIPDSVTTIESNAFENCSSLQTVTLPTNLTSIGYRAFKNCTLLDGIIFPDGLQSIGVEAFYYCTSLSSIVVPDGVLLLGSSSFYYCNNLSSIIFAGDAPSIKASAFYRVSADVYYPIDNETWTSSVMQNYGGNLTWIGVCQDHVMGDWFVYRAATCTEDGENRRNCNNCSHYETEVIPATGHSYESLMTAPTCTEQGYTTHTCANCGDSYVDTYVDALGHDMSEWATVTEATCTEDGTERRDCSRCDHYEIRIIEATGHSYESVATAPTCTEQGYTTHTCSACGDSYVDTYVDALGHDLGEWTAVTEATCTEDGAERRDCSRCDHYETRTIEASGHSFGTWFVNRAATCTETGENRRNCNNCSHYETEVIPATGHRYESVATAPTCTEQGFVTHTCSICGHSFVDTYVDALGHDMGAWAAVTEATCTEDGTERRNCSRCDHYETRTIEASGHSFGAWFVNRAATCTETGENRRNCTNCSHYETEVIPATGHSYESVVTAPTCTEQGYTTHTCSACGDSYVDTYVDALGHNWDEGIVTVEPTEEAVGEMTYTCERCGKTRTEIIPELEHEHHYEAVITEPTCTEQGYTAHTCRCGDSYVDAYVDALGHDLGEWVIVTEASCTEAGYERRDCSRCDHYETRTIVAAGHSYESVVTAPTCTEQGYTTHTCSVCDDTYVDTYVDALGHDLGEWIVVIEATCTEDGQELRECGRCDHYETRIIEAHGHSYESIVTAPTCTEQGYTRYICSVCGDSYVSDYVAPAGHDHVAVVTAPTCTERGYTTYTCHCGDRYVSDHTAALGHDMGDWENVTEATCTETGEQIRDCSRCDHAETRAIEALGHDWDEGVVTIEPTEDTEGELTYTCFRCGETRTEAIPELEHEHRYEAVVTAPTCTEQGYTTHICRCGDSYVDTYVDALGHDMSEWFTVTEATCTADGMEQCDCSRCDYHETRVIEATGHDYESVVTGPTCTEQGLTIHTCVNCGDSYTDSYIDALGHSFTKYVSDGNATCTQDGTKTAVCDRCDATDTVTDVGSAHGHDFTDWTVVQKPTEAAEGLESRCCLHCGIEETRTIARLENPFADVPSDSFFYEPVMWAVANGVTNGTSATTFGPNDQCMRAHVVTFLWRAVGSPEPTRTDNPFVDVKETDFFYKAVMWALENGITSGMDATHFGPTAYCNRAQVVTFLYRTMGSPEVESTENPFTDVTTGAFYEKAVLWAVENGITNGLSATAFGPNAICNRAQIVTFLYRAFVKD